MDQMMEFKKIHNTVYPTMSLNILMTLPLTFLTFGLFLLVINGVVVLLADRWIDGFKLENFTAAVVMSIVMSVLGSLMERLQRRKQS
jgi:putative membrane protein